MPNEPRTKRTVAFVDGQNLYHAAKEAFGHFHPSYDVLALSQEICRKRQWALGQVRFYTGIPKSGDNPFWQGFWANKLRAMSRQGVWVFSRPLRYRNRRVRLAGGTTHSFLTGEEKGIDVRIALDVVRMARRGDFDVAIIFSQDQDLSEVAEEVRVIARERDKWLKIASAFPSSPASRNRRGINKTDWIRIDRQTYESCVDSHDHRPKKGPAGVDEKR